MWRSMLFGGPWAKRHGRRGSWHLAVLHLSAGSPGDSFEAPKEAESRRPGPLWRYPRAARSGGGVGGIKHEQSVVIACAQGGFPEPQEKS